MGAAGADVLIYGAGVIGCAIARELAGEGVSVLVVETARPGQGASGAAAGLLTPQSHAEAPGPFVDLARASFALFPGLAEELRLETSIDVEISLRGSIRVPAERADGTSDAPEISSLLAWQKAAGWRLELVGADRIAQRTRGRLAAGFREGVDFPDEGTVNVRRLTPALARSAEIRGAKFRFGETVRSLRWQGNRCIGVDTDRGPIDAGIVLNAAGAWAGGNPELPLPVRPVRGQIIELEDEEQAPECPVLRGDFYVVPLSGGRLLLGSTQEEAGFDQRVTVDAVRMLLRKATELMPSLSRAAVSRAWAGLRPGTPDGLPLLGRTPIDGLFVASGHFRNGILLAPITAKILAALILGRESPMALDPFRPERFALHSGRSLGKIFKLRN